MFGRLTLACGGMAMNSFDDLNPECLGRAGLVYEHTLVSEGLIDVVLVRGAERGGEGTTLKGRGGGGVCELEERAEVNQCALAL